MNDNVTVLVQWVADWLLQFHEQKDNHSEYNELYYLRSAKELLSGHPDLALIDREAEKPKNWKVFKRVLTASKEDNDLVQLGYNCHRQDILSADWKPVIPLASAIEEGGE